MRMIGIQRLTEWLHRHISVEAQLPKPITQAKETTEFERRPIGEFGLIGGGRSHRRIGGKALECDELAICQHPQEVSNTGEVLRIITQG